ncbi:MAG: DUF983 domain-containing protein [Pirellulales bacterium]
MGFSTLVWRSLRLRCPMCGQGRLFAGWFRMRPECEACGTRFEREAGFFLGSIYFNYGLTALVVAIGYPVLLFTRTLGETKLLVLTLAFTLLFPMWFFRYARALWLGFDQFMDPRHRTDVHYTPDTETHAHDTAGDVPAAADRPAVVGPSASDERS